MTQTPGLAAAFFTLTFFTVVGFMVHVPLDHQRGKAVIQYLALGFVPVLARSVPEKLAISSPGWWPVTLWILAAVFIAADVADLPERHRRKEAEKTLICIVLILFCMGVSYIASACLTALVGIRFSWAAASFILAALIRNTTGMGEEEFPDEACETVRRVSLCVMAVTLVLPA